MISPETQPQNDPRKENQKSACGPVGEESLKKMVFIPPPLACAPGGGLEPTQPLHFVCPAPPGGAGQGAAAYFSPAAPFSFHSDTSGVAGRGMGMDPPESVGGAEGPEGKKRSYARNPEDGLPGHGSRGLLLLQPSAGEISLRLFQA